MSGSPPGHRRIESEFEVDEYRPLNTWLANSLKNTAVENAMITQHTLFPYQFVQNSPRLNELGEAQMELLSVHYRENPGELSIRKGNASDSLYDSRIEMVRNFLGAAFVDMGRMTIEDAAPGGDGASSERVISILADKEDTSSSGSSDNLSTQL